MRRLDANTVEAACTNCGCLKTIPMSVAAETRWNGGALIQNVLPDFEEREILIGGLCNNCFDEMFADDEADD